MKHNLNCFVRSLAACFKYVKFATKYSICHYIYIWCVFVLYVVLEADFEIHLAATWGKGGAAFIDEALFI